MCYTENSALYSYAGKIIAYIYGHASTRELDEAVQIQTDG